MVFARCSTDPISTPPMVSLLADLDLSIFGAILGSSQKVLKSENQKRFHTKLPGQHSRCSSHGSPLLRSQFQGCRRHNVRAATELMILLQRIVSSDLTCGHKNTGRLILKGEKVQNMLTSRLISENLIRTEICFDVYCYGKPAV